MVASNKCTLTRFTKLWCTLLLVLWTHSTSSGQTDSAGEAKAKRLIQRNAETILFFAHPTATYVSIDMEEIKKKDPGFLLIYKLRWKSLFDDEEWTKWSFTFDKSGSFQRLTVLNRSNLFPRPFTASNVALQFVKDLLKKDEQLQKNEKLLEAIEDQDARKVLELYLKYLASSNP